MWICMCFILRINTILNFRIKHKEKILDSEYLNLEELRAFFGILYMAGVLQSSHLNIRDLWSNDSAEI